MTGEAEDYRIGDAERALGGLSAAERSYREPGDKCDEHCCQCLCPMDRAGKIWHKPQRQPNEQDKEYHSRLIKVWASDDWPPEGRPLVTLCWDHNDPNNPDRRTHHG